MSATNAPFGLEAVSHPSGMCRATAYVYTAAEWAAAASYALNIFYGDPVNLASTAGAGTIQLATGSAGTRQNAAAGTLVLGVFAGIEYVDGTGKPTEAKYWPASTALLSGSYVTVYVYDDPATIFTVQCDGALTNDFKSIGAQADITGMSAPGGSTTTGQSLATLSATIKTAGNTGQFKIVGFDKTPGNTPTDAYPVVQVMINNHQLFPTARAAATQA